MSCTPDDTSHGEISPGAPSQAASADVGQGAALADWIGEAAGDAESGAGTLLDRFLDEPSDAKSLLRWLGPCPDSDREELVRRLNRDVASIDDLLSQQVNAIIHHPAFQRLESSWRGLQHLAEQAEDVAGIKIRMLSVTWKELARDAERALEFDQSQLFRKIYGDEFGTPGGEPFGVLLGDYQIHHRPSSDHPVDDIAVLTSISRVAAAAFAPFISSADPAMFGLDSFADLELPLNLAGNFEQAEFLKWRAFRDTEDSRFVGLTVPHVLMRLPYDDDGSRVDGFQFREDVEGPDRSKYLWGSAAYAFGGVLMRAFAASGWLAEIRGVEPGVDGGGLVTGLPVHSFTTDKQGVAPKSSTDVTITDYQEKELGELGFIPLCPCKDTELSAFYGNQSVQKPKAYDRLPATVNARLSSMVQYMLCVSRFAHYVKVIGREKIGSFGGTSDFQTYLHNWLLNYTTASEDLSQEAKARYPLREAKVQVRENPGKPGSYLCVIHLRPHYQLDDVSASMRLVTELSPGRAP